MNFYGNESDRMDLESRRHVNDQTVYAEDASCDWCGERLNGYTFECEVCKALLCPIHSCVDGRCPEHTKAGQSTDY